MTIDTIQDRHTHYRDQAVVTASPARLVLMLFDRAILGIERGRTALSSDRRDLELASRELVRAQEIVDELNFSLDRDRGGEIAQQLGTLYEYCRHRLVRANLAKDPSLLDSPAEVLRELRSAWETVVEAEGTL